VVNCSRHQIWKMFNNISKQYDFLNHLLSLGMDFSWRKYLSKQINSSDNQRILDLCTGTGDQAFSILKNSSINHSITGIDTSAEMINSAIDKADKKQCHNQIKFIEGDASNIPFKAESFDAVTISFGIRNVENIEKCMLEVYRILKNNGKFFILEFSTPKNFIIRSLFLFYLTFILPNIAGLVSGDRKAYIYLSETIKTFPYGNKFLEYFRDTDFKELKYVPMTFGTVSFYQGVKKH
jgi:demethylmenaquinone methyltransferase / 2-methoxy-6-polyprenyl-1,4-benzoquinol methylase